MEFIIEHYKELGVIITGVLGLVITLYSKVRDSNIKDKELEIKKIQYLDNKKYQLSKEKYQELMSKKIEMLEKISVILVEYYKKIPFMGLSDGDVIDGRLVDLTIKKENLALKTFLQIDGILELNQLLIPDSIQEIYQEIKEKLSIQNADYENFNDNSSDKDEIIDAYKDKDKKFYAKNKSSLELLFNLLKEEIQIVRKGLQI